MATRNRSRLAIVLALYFCLAAVYTHPLLRLSGTHIASDAGDPILNASILWWNAITVPFSHTWWNPPYFYPAGNISAFTENLQGIAPLSTPIFWLTGNPLTTYNLALFLTWPLSAFAVYLLVRRLTSRDDAAFLAGLAYGFSPYRTAELGHLQMVSAYWIPLALLGLHGYLSQRRARWLVLFGVAWLLQSLANGYLMLFGGVLIAAWLAYFCSTRETWRVLPPVMATWVIASLPLLPVMLKYRAVHEYFGLRRALTEPLAFSAPLRAFGEVSPMVWLWGRVLPESGDNLFPGVTAVLLVAAGCVAAVRHNGGGWNAPAWLRAVLIVLLTLGGAATLVTLLVGPWRISPFGLVIRMAEVSRAVTVALGSGIALIALSARARDVLARRSVLVFYAAATVLMAVFACGPVLRVGMRAVLDPAPYRFLMSFPGFLELRVPTRFWMLGVLCLAVAAGLAFARLVRLRPARRTVLFSIVAVGVMMDGWLSGVPMAQAPGPWPRVERRDQALPILELPLGPSWDAAATFRSIWHRRPVVNGVSGYDPSYYDPLQAGLNAHDPAVLLALSTLGSFDIVVNGDDDKDGGWARYAASVNGATVVATDGVRAAYRVPATAAPGVRLGEILPIVAVTAFRHDPTPIADGKVYTEWGDDPQRPGQWVTVDLGSVHDTGGISYALGEYARDFPRLLVIETSTDGATWIEVWRGGTVGQAVLAAIHEPIRAEMKFAFPTRPARFIRLRQLARHKNMWRIAELRVHAPARGGLARAGL